MADESLSNGLSDGSWPALQDAIAAGDGVTIALAAEAMFGELERLIATDPAAAVAGATSAVGLLDLGATVAFQLRSCRMLAMALAHSNRFDEALAICVASERLPGAETEPVEVARIRLASMQPLVVLGHVDDAIATGRAALETLDDMDRGPLAGRAALNLGATLAMTGRPGEALPFFDRAADLLSDDPVLLGQIATNQGTALAALDRFEESERSFQLAAELLDTDEMAWSAAIVHGNLADLAARQGAIQRSLHHFEESRRRLEQDGALGDLGRLDAEQAAVLTSLGLSAEGRDAFSRAIEMLRTHGTAGDLLIAQVAFGSAMIAAGEASAAAALLEGFRDDIDPEEHAELRMRVLAMDADLALALRDHDRGRRLIDDGLALSRDLPVQRVAWLLRQASLANLTGEIDRGRAILLAALATAERSGVTPLVAEIQTQLAVVSASTGHPDAAEDHARRAVAAIEAIRGTMQADRLRHAFHRGRLDIYATLFRSLIAQPDVAAQQEAFGLAERMRSRSLHDAIALRRDDLEVTSSATPAERHLIAELATQRRWLNWMYSAIASGHEPGLPQQAELHEREGLAATLSDRLAILRPRPAFDAPRPLQAIQEHLGPGTLILSYLVTEDTVTVQAVMSDRVEGYAEIAKGATIAELVARLQFQIGRQLAGGMSSTSSSRGARLQRDVDLVLEQLYALLIGPVEHCLTDRSQLIVVPSGDLHGIPFAALRSGDAYLIDRLAVVTTPGVSVLVGMDGDRSPADWGAPGPERPLIVGVPDDATPGLGREATRLADRFAGGTTLIGPDATRSAVLARIESADLVHLACHGRFDSDHPNASGLRLADGWLTLDQIVDLRLDRPLVLLSGCETGRVRVDRGDELVGIMSAMIGAGASGLMTSLWKTQDDAATSLIESFYDLRLAGADPVTALQAAQRHVRRSWPHPAYWAPFVVASFSHSRDDEERR